MQIAKSFSAPVSEEAECNSSYNLKRYSTSIQDRDKSILFRQMCTLPLHFFGIAGNEEAQGPFLHLDMVTRVYERAVGRGNHTLFRTG